MRAWNILLPSVTEETRPDNRIPEDGLARKSELLLCLQIPPFSVTP